MRLKGLKNCMLAWYRQFTKYQTSNKNLLSFKRLKEKMFLAWEVLERMLTSTHSKQMFPSYLVKLK